MVKILVVDDEYACTLFLSSALQDEGYEVVSSLRGDEAIEIGLQFGPDLLISDWMLKDQLDGVDVARALSQRFPTLKIVFITGLAEETLRRKATGFHYLKILEKPVELLDILTLIESHFPRSAVVE